MRLVPAFVMIVPIFAVTGMGSPARAVGVCTFEKDGRGNWVWVCSNSDGTRTVQAPPPGVKPPSDDAIAPGFRGKITYQGYLEGNVSYEERSRNRVRVGGINIPTSSQRNVPIHGSYTADVEYDGNTVSGTERVTSDIRGVSSTSTFRGTRNGTNCEIVSNEGIRVRAVCTPNKFAYDQDNINGQQQHVVLRVVSDRSAIVDYAERDRQAAVAAAAAEKQRAASMAQAAQEAAALASKPAASNAQSALLEAAVQQDSGAWVLNRYRPGSIRNVRVVRSGAITRLHADYTYSFGRTGWVEANIQSGKIVCLEYWDTDGCYKIRSAQYADGGEKHDTTAKQNPRDCLYFAQYTKREGVHNEPGCGFTMSGCSLGIDVSSSRGINSCSYPIRVNITNNNFINGNTPFDRDLYPGDSIDGLYSNMVNSVQKIK